MWRSVAKSSMPAAAVGAIGPERYFDEPRFQWQGRRQPFRERLIDDGMFWDVQCFSCGWERAYSYEEFMEAMR